MRINSNEGLHMTYPNSTMHGWRILSRTVDVATNYVSKEWLRITGTGGELNVSGLLCEFACPQGNQTEITYRETNVGVWLYPNSPSLEVRTYDVVFSFGSPFTQTTIASGGTSSSPNTSWISFWVKSKDYATKHSITFRVYCNDWSRVTITYP